MATILIELTEEEVREACKIFATTRVLNEGNAILTELTETDVADGNTLRRSRGCKVWVETDRMARTAQEKGGG